MGSARPHARLYWAIIGSVVVSDLITKWMAVDALGPTHLPRQVFGDVVRFTLVYNAGAAFGIHLGPYSRAIFTALTIAALFILGRLYVQTRPGDVPRVVALALVIAGALGNLVDRLRSGRGVVDFIDVGIGTLRWPTFNVADSAISCGAVLLAWVLWREDAQRRATVDGSDAPLPG